MAFDLSIHCGKLITKFSEDINGYLISDIPTPERADVKQKLISIARWIVMLW